MIRDHRPAASFATLLVALASLAAALLLAGCGGEGASSTTSGPSAPATTASTAGPGAGFTSTSVTGGQASADWPTYHHDAARSGVSSDQEALGSVKQVWTSQALDAAVYAQPLVVGDRVYVATEGDSVYALEAGTGAIIWKQALGQSVPGSMLPCGNIDPSGITGTPVVDIENGVLYAVANLRSGPHHELFALALANGAVKWHRAIDPPGLSPAVEQQRGALALSDDRVYVPFGGLYGDCGAYKGAVVSVAMDGSGDMAAYIVPTSRMAGIWNPAGPVVDGAGDVWVTTGNSAGQSTFDFGDAIIRLDAGLQVVDYFAPSNWPSLNARDADLGSTGPVLLPGSRVLAMGKDGVAYLANSADLGHVGNPVASLDIGTAAFGAAAVDGGRVFIPCTKALVALDAAGDTLTVAWKLSGGSGPPIIAGGAVWALGYDGAFRAVDPASGKVLFSAKLGKPVSRFISPAAAGGRVFVADGDAIVALALR
jgi:outer membrane protein assembly factor BamB